MTVFSSFNSNERSQRLSQTTAWQTVVLLTTAFWLSSSLILDSVIMPILYGSGMMIEPGFATTGYSIFWAFNRIELVCAALILTGVLALYQRHSAFVEAHSTAIACSVVLLGVALSATYGLSPQMSALGLRLDWFSSTLEIPAGMTQLHIGYWLLEGIKFVAGGWLLNLCVRTS